MKAWQFSSTMGGLENNLKINSSAAIPTPKPDHHLVRILAIALNPVDYKPADVQLIHRLAVPKPATPGIDFVGRIVKPAAGSSLKPDQLVYGLTGSSALAGSGLAEYAAVNKVAAVPLPEKVSPIDAASIGIAGLTAWQSIMPHIERGSRLFLNGGSGGTGIFGIQIAKAAGAHVTTTCSTANVELCKSLGADEVIDYKKQSVVEALKQQKPFDHVVDNVGSDFNLYWSSHLYTTTEANFVGVAGEPSFRYLSFMLKVKLWPGFLGGGKRKHLGIFATPKLDQLEQIANWMAEGKVRAVIDEKFPFEQAPEAFRKLKTGRAKGKIIVEGTSEMAKA